MNVCIEMAEAWLSSFRALALQPLIRILMEASNFHGPCHEIVLPDAIILEVGRRQRVELVPKGFKPVCIGL